MTNREYQWDGTGNNWPDWLPNDPNKILFSDGKSAVELGLVHKIVVPTLAGFKTAYPGDWIISEDEGRLDVRKETK